MRLLYAYTEFLNRDGSENFHRGFSKLSLNFSTDRHFSYHDGNLTVTELTHPIPADFFGERIYNVTTIVGDNGAGKTTILHHLIGILQQFYEGKYHGNDRGLLVVEDHEKTWVLQFPEEHSLNLEIIPDGIEQMPFHLISEFLSATKLVYLANTLTNSDLELVRQQPAKTSDQHVNLNHFRYEFLYNCSTTSLIVENCQNDSGKSLGSVTEYLNCFFAYEQYKQVKYVFDKRQYDILEELKDHHVPVPKKLIVELKCEDYSTVFSNFAPYQYKSINFGSLDEQYDYLIYELCNRCVEGFLKTAILYTKEKDPTRYVNIVYQKAEWKRFRDSDISMRSEMICQTLRQIHDVYNDVNYAYERSEPQSLMQSLHRNCTDFINFILNEKKHLQKYFELKVPTNEEMEKNTKQSITFSIKTEGEAAIWFITFLQKYRYTCEPYYYLNFHWGLSSGEQNLLRLFSSLYYIFDADYNNHRHGNYKIYNQKHGQTAPCDSVLLWIDEADLTYHPEWQRCFLSILTAFLPRIYPESCCKDIQIFLTTHSPLMLGDSPSQSVIYLSKDAKGHVMIDDSGTRQTFGENLYMLLQNSFRVQNGAIGELVRIKIQEILQTIDEIDRNLKDSSNKKDDMCSKIFQLQGRLQIYKESVVAFLADGIIKAKLETEIERCLQKLKSSMDGKQNPLAKLSNTQLEKQLSAITEELDRRKGELI